ncbi:unnamed protein product [Blepharisma stoltei]|uniref:Uncharacterized protein n=1 Tax=Blepharisma stoltei TaxID=1481888 RepID=A0AAU9IIA2_9CILI|nr:unnamed protein product [Blepharisma stoltei]
MNMNIHLKSFDFENSLTSNSNQRFLAPLGAYNPRSSTSQEKAAKPRLRNLSSSKENEDHIESAKRRPSTASEKQKLREIIKRCKRHEKSQEILSFHKCPDLIEFPKFPERNLNHRKHSSFLHKAQASLKLRNFKLDQPQNPEIAYIHYQPISLESTSFRFTEKYKKIKEETDFPRRIFKTSTRRTLSNHLSLKEQTDSSDILRIHKCPSLNSTRSKSVPRKTRSISRAASDVQTETNDEEIEIQYSNFAIYEKESQEEESPIRREPRYLM